MDPHEAAAYRRLWQKVLVAAVIDYLVPTSEDAGRADKAERWFRSRDFAMVASLAGMDPAFLRDRIRPLLAAPDAERRAFVRMIYGHFSGQRGKRSGAKSTLQTLGRPLTATPAARAAA